MCVSWSSVSWIDWQESVSSTRGCSIWLLDMEGCIMTIKGCLLFLSLFFTFYFFLIPVDSLLLSVVLLLSLPPAESQTVSCNSLTLQWNQASWDVTLWEEKKEIARLKEGKSLGKRNSQSKWQVMHEHETRDSCFVNRTFLDRKRAVESKAQTAAESKRRWQNKRLTQGLDCYFTSERVTQDTA